MKHKRDFTAEDNKNDLAIRRRHLEIERQALPAYAAATRLVELVKANRTVVLVGDTGSGKTTQVPQILLRSGLAGGHAIAITQPRRVAAMTVARRVAQEMGTSLGDVVGYSIRFDDTTSANTRIKYMTDGMLLREAILDPALMRYQVVVIDEAHERTVHTDVLLGLLKRVQEKRGQSFRLIIMSATLDAEKFTGFFSGAVAGHIQGRQHPVQVLYTLQPQDSYLEAALTATVQIHMDEPPGDVLVFLTGQDEIEAAERLLRGRIAALDRENPSHSNGSASLVVVPMYAALPPEQQLKAFEPAPAHSRKAILATNIAETSITLPGIRYVVDTGFVKQRAYSARLGADALEVVPVSQAQARQRSGRAGREAPGKAFRLYTEAAFGGLPAATPPEIQRSNLSSVVLQLKALGVDDLLNFDFIDPPPKAAIIRSLELLYALGALDKQGKLTEVGQSLSRLPVDPMYGKMLLAAVEAGCSEEAVMVVALISAENIFVDPRDKREEAGAARTRFIHRHGDHLTLLAAFRALEAVPRRDMGAWCNDNFINLRSMKRAQDIREQLRRHFLQAKLPLKSCGDTEDSLRRSIAAGLFPHAARRQVDGSYKVIATGQVVHIHPSSVLHGKKPDCVVFNDIMRTTRQYARVLTVIDPLWLPEIAPTFFSSKSQSAHPQS